jgi:hypothetical protein
MLNLTGEKFGRLTVIVLEKIYHTKHNRKSYWKCACDCGKITIVRGVNLTSGNTASCGCDRHKGNRTPDTNFIFLYNAYRNRAKIKNLEFSLSKEDFKKLTKSNCYYCDIEPSQIKTRSNSNVFPYVYNGIDRIDNKKGYILNNCRPCCKHCNTMKWTMTVKEFKEKLNSILEKEENIENNIPISLIKFEKGLNEVFNYYIARAGTRNIPFVLTKEKFAELSQNSCYYCGSVPKEHVRKGKYNQNFIYNGIDRLDSSKGYTNENCVSCCEICNRMKNTLSKEEFLTHIHKIVNHMNW